MNKILVEVSVGELLDKISILEIKKEKISEPESIKFIEKEYLILKEQLNKNIKSDKKSLQTVLNILNPLLEAWTQLYEASQNKGQDEAAQPKNIASKC